MSINLTFRWWMVPIAATLELTTVVKSCFNCPMANRSVYQCTKYRRDDQSTTGAFRVYEQNKDQLTPSCPMWNETKESETK